MSNHYSAANLKFPGDDARLDFTDLFVFASPDDPGKTVLIIDLNPYTTGMSAMPPFLMKSEFHPDGIYRINIDTDGDAQADARVHVRVLRTPGRQADRDRLLRDRPGGPRARAVRRGAHHRHPGRLRRRRPARPGGPGPSCSSACAATRSSPTRTAPSTASSGPGRTHSPTGTSCPSRWRCPTTCSAPTRRSECGPRSACAATARSSRSTAVVTRRSTRSSTRTTSRTSTTCAQPVDDVANYLELWSKFLRGQRRLLAGGSEEGSPDRAARRPALRPRPSRLPTRTAAP